MMLLMSQNQKTQSLQRKVFTEIGIERLVVITETQIVHRKAFIGRYNAFGGNSQLEFLLLLRFNRESVALKEILCFNGIIALR